MNRSILSINDLHMGVQRVAGTTPQSMAHLRADLATRIERLVMAHLDKHLYINGDAFDSYSVEMSELFRLLQICCKWLDESHMDGPCTDQPMLKIARGNHDISKDSSRMSAFDFLTAVLISRYPGRVEAITEPTMAWPGHYVIPHMPNQALFDLALEQAATCQLDGLCYLHLHANLHNQFAVEADHSLNVSAEQVAKLVGVGYHLVFGHVHQQLEERGVTVVGNQFPTSIADCLGNSSKRAIIFQPDMMRDEVKTWNIAGSFVEIDWEYIATAPLENFEFIRVTGKVELEDAAKVLQLVSKLRQASDAYVVTNSVKFAGQGDVEELEVTAEEMKAMDVLEYLFEQLEPEQAAVVKRLLEKQGGDNVARA